MIEIVLFTFLSASTRFGRIVMTSEIVSALLLLRPGIFAVNPKHALRYKGRHIATEHEQPVKYNTWTFFLVDLSLVDVIVVIAGIIDASLFVLFPSCALSIILLSPLRATCRARPLVLSPVRSVFGPVQIFATG